MALLNDTLEIRLCSPDYQQDWGLLGDPDYAVLTKIRSAADLVELRVAGGSPQREFLLRDQCGIVVKLRGKVEFMGHIYQRSGGVLPEDPVTVWARDETEVFDNTLAWVAPERIQFAGSWGNLYSSGNIEAEAQLDVAQSFPDPFMDPGHFMWAWPYVFPGTWNWRSVIPSFAGEFISPVLIQNLNRIGYSRGRLYSGTQEITGSGTGFAVSEGAPWRVVNSWPNPTDEPPWVDGFGGSSVRFQTLREVVNDFRTWVDANNDQSFEMFCDGSIGRGPYEVRIGFRVGPALYPTPLSVVSGTVVAGTWTISDHTASRVVLGGPGEQEARLFQEARNLGRESNGRVVEIFKDSTGAKLMAINQQGYEDRPRYYFVDPDVPAGYKNRARAYFRQQGARYLAEGAPTTSVTVELQETATVYYGGTAGYQIGQMVEIDLGFQKVKSRIERVTISLTRENGLLVVPQVGSEERSADDISAKFLRGVAVQQRRDNSER